MVAGTNEQWRQRDAGALDTVVRDHGACMGRSDVLAIDPVRACGGPAKRSAAHNDAPRDPPDTLSARKRGARV